MRERKEKNFKGKEKEVKEENEDEIKEKKGMWINHAHLFFPVKYPYLSITAHSWIRFRGQTEQIRNMQIIQFYSNAQFSFTSFCSLYNRIVIFLLCKALIRININVKAEFGSVDRRNTLETCIYQTFYVLFCEYFDAIWIKKVVETSF